MPMSGEAARYARAAAKCRGWAETARTVEEKEKLEDLARQYDELAALARAVPVPTAKTEGVAHVWTPPGRRKKPSPGPA